MPMTRSKEQLPKLENWDDPWAGEKLYAKISIHKRNEDDDE